MGWFDEDRVYNDRRPEAQRWLSSRLPRPWTRSEGHLELLEPLAGGRAAWEGAVIAAAGGALAVAIGVAVGFDAPGQPAWTAGLITGPAVLLGWLLFLRVPYLWARHALPATHPHRCTFAVADLHPMVQQVIGDALSAALYLHWIAPTDQIGDREIAEFVGYALRASQITAEVNTLGARPTTTAAAAAWDAMRADVDRGVGSLHDDAELFIDRARHVDQTTRALTTAVDAQVEQVRLEDTEMCQVEHVADQLRRLRHHA